MYWMTRLTELWLTHKKLSDSKSFVLKALSGLAIVIVLGVFGAVLLALMLSSALWLGYGSLLSAGAQITLAASVVGIVSALLLIVTLIAALRLWRDVQKDILLIFRSQTPLVGQVADRVGDVAGAFMSGLREKSPVAKKR